MDTTESRPRQSQRRRRRPQRRRQIDWQARLCDCLLVLVVVGSALAIGTVHVPVLLAVSALALVGATIEMLALRRVPWPSVVLAGLGLFSALQAIPLPAAWTNRVSPATADVWLRCLAPFGEPALRHFPMSLDAGASVAEALKWFTYSCVYVLATRMRARRGSVWLAVMLFGSAALVTLITLLHGVANVAVLYGVYHPTFAPGRWNVGPLLNSNNLGGYAILGLFSGGGLLLCDRSPLPRLPVAIGMGVISAAICLSGSRAAVLSVLLAGAATLVWQARSRGARFALRALLLGLGPLSIGIAIAIALGTAKDATQLATLDVRRKASVWLWSLPMIREHALFGVGRGAFETAFPPYRQALDYDWSIVVTHAENFVFQWVAEWGVPVGLGAVVAIVGYVLREWHANQNEPLRFMVMTGLIAFFVQNLADLGLEIPALAIAAVLALAAGERPKAALSDAAKPLGKFAMILSAGACTLWAATLAWSRWPVELERGEVSVGYRTLEIKSASERSRFRGRLHEAVLRHPGESFFPLLGALVAMRTHGDSLPWLGRALELAPTNGPVHLVLAELLQSHGATTQAMLHLRLAAEYDRTLGGIVGARAPLWAPSIDLLMQAIPEGPRGASVLLDACARERRVELKTECFRRAALADPSSPEAHQQLAEQLLHLIRAGQQPCNKSSLETCTNEAEAAIRAAERLTPKSWRLGYLMAKVLLARGDTVGAARLLTSVCPPNTEGDDCWHDALATAIQSGSNDAISAAASASGARPCDGMESCAKAFATLASNLESGGQLALACTFFTKAAEADPSATRWLTVAEHAQQAQLYGVARTALDRADRSPDASVSTRAHAELLREKVARATGPTL